MNIKTIPKSLLYHTVTYEQYNGSSWGDEYLAPVTIENVLVQPISSIKRNNTTEDIVFDSVVFYDGQLSLPQDIEFKKGSRVTHKGQVMTVEEVTPLYVFNDVLHHIEIGLR